MEGMEDMKKMILTILIAVLVVPCLLAGALDTQKLEVGLNLSESGGVSEYKIGFSSTEVDGTAEKYKPTAVAGNSLDLAFDESGQTASNSKTALWVYWHITSGEDMVITLKGDADLTKSGASDGNGTIGWNIQLDSKTAQDRSASQTVKEHTPSGENGVVGSHGSSKVTITTDDMTSLTLEPGDYVANLVLEITSKGSGSN